MSILKKRITRIFAFLISCVLFAVFTFGAVSNLIKCDELYSYEDDYISTYQYEHDTNELFTKLWAVGVMYLRNLDEKGEFSGNKELKESTENAMKSLGLMDESGNIIIDDLNIFDYTVSWNKNELTNSKQTYDEMRESGYALSQKNGSIDAVSPELQWLPDDLYWYSTNYGMYYYYLSGRLNKFAAAVFDYDTSDLDYYTDENGADIYYKKDGTTPIPYENFSQVEYVNEDDVDVDHVQEVPDDENRSTYFLYTSDGEWIELDNESFTTQIENENPLKICVSPNAEMIAAHEKQVIIRNEAMDDLLRSLVNLVPLLVTALILMLYVWIIGGYSEEKGCFVLRTFDKVFVEVLLALMAAAVVGAMLLITPENLTSIYDMFNNLYKYMSVMYTVLFTAAFAIISLSINCIIIKLKCKSFWKTSIIGRVFMKFWNYLKKLAVKFRKCIISRDMLRNDVFARRFMRRFLICIAAGILAVIMGLSMGSAEFIMFAAIIISVAYLLLSMRDLNELTKLGEHISKMNGGDYSKCEVEEKSVAYGMTQKLNNISVGLESAVERQIKSERMKIDLVTNVSHDLKTPLTSIISYINLLSMEELTPEAKDYVKILENKSERLSAIVADLFDLAKATSCTDVQLETIDMVILVGQVLGDMEDKIKKFDKDIRTEILMSDAPICAEGKKLYRVLQNLIDNALKYSMDGTRIYLTLKEENKKAVVVLKNISAYEMKFTPEEITERFTRGDKSRTSEGNGLGLSIAKSFTEACGGEFAVKIDGDVYSAELKFALVEKEPKLDDEEIK